MKTVILIFTLLVAVNASAIESVDTGSERNAINDNIQHLLEELRDDMPYRDPPLDPLNIEHRDIDNTFAEILTLTGKLDDITIAGLSDFDVNTVRFTLLGLRLDVDLLFNSIILKGLYDIDGALADYIPVYGNGTFLIKTESLQLNVRARLGTINGFLNLSEFRLNPTMDSIFVNIEGLIGGGEASDLINIAINDHIHDLLREYSNTIDNSVETLIQNTFNPTLNNMTVSDLISMITGS